MLDQARLDMQVMAREGAVNRPLFFSKSMLNQPINPLDLLSTAVLLVDTRGEVIQANLAAESLLGQPAHQLIGQPLEGLLVHPSEVMTGWIQGEEMGVVVRRLQTRWFVSSPAEGRMDRVLDTSINVLDEPGFSVAVELREPDAAQRVDREERQAVFMQMNQSLLRNLGHEVKNPLGGIRGAAQLLDAELPTKELKEYTQVIIKESDRLQALVDRMLAPVRRSRSPQSVNLHEVLERVRTLVLSEFSDGLVIQRDYDTSLPEIEGDLERLIQAVLNIVRNAAQAIASQSDRTEPGRILLRTRAVRQVTLHRQRYRLGLHLTVHDNGPGIPEAIRDEIFYPLVSGNPQGHGLGLTLAQSIVHQHGGTIECSSASAGTAFDIVLPVGLPVQKEWIR